MHFVHTVTKQNVTLLEGRRGSGLSSVWVIADTHCNTSQVAERMQSTRPSLNLLVDALS